MHKIMVTSSHASEGKSFLSMNIMRTLAKLGKAVVLVLSLIHIDVYKRQHLGRSISLYVSMSQPRMGIGAASFLMFFLALVILIGAAAFHRRPSAGQERKSSSS